MRLRLFFAAFLVLVASRAYADTYDFSIHECFDTDCRENPNFYFEFQLAVPPLPDSYSATSFTYNHFDLIQAGSSVGAGPYLTFTEYGFSLHNVDYNPGIRDDDVFSIDEFNDDLPLFDGPTSDPLFQTGTTDVNLNHTYFEYGNGVGGPLTITDLDAVPTPEPSSIALLGTGLLGVLGLTYRRVS